MRGIALGVALVCALTGLGACATDGGRFGVTDGLKLDRVVLYRNGVGYFERRGEVDGDVLRIRCRKDQVNDILKSLTVVDKSSGVALSVSMPLDPQSWANAALSTLKPGQGDLGSVLDSLRGTWVSLRTSTKSVTGRILMVETATNAEGIPDRRISVLNGDLVHVVLLSQVTSVRFQDGELAMQLNRSLDASSGEGIFQQVMVEIRLAGDAKHDLMISYVVAAPIWKPTYRVILPEEGDDALLQAWAVVDNISGEDWTDVRMSLTSGTPIAFRFDLHTPRNVWRPDLSALGGGRAARVSTGESSLPTPPPAAKEVAEYKKGKKDRVGERRRPRAKASAVARGYGGPADDFSGAVAPEPDQDEEGGILAEELRASTRAQTRASRSSGLTRYDLEGRVTVPDGTSTMVAILNEGVKAEQTFLYRPGGAGVGYEQNPYRVVRFTNSTPFVLETGPISIYSGGSFVGEGIAKTISANASTTIPFSVEQEIVVTSSNKGSSGDARLVKMAAGVLTVETWQRYVTIWKVVAPVAKTKRKVLVRQSPYGSSYSLKTRPEGTEDVSGAWLFPVFVEAGKTEGELEVVQRTPRRRNISIWDGSATKVLASLVSVENMDAALLKRLEPIISKRKEIADIDREVANLKKQQRELDQRADQTRRNLEAIKKDPAGGRLRARLSKRLNEFTKEGDKLGRRVVELTSQRLERKIEIDELIDGLTFELDK
jgi:hypothetical protein